MSALTVASLFAGIGGLDLGFERAGYDVAFATDILPSAVSAYRANFDRDAIRADITEFDLGRIPSTDVVIGGPPCQSFSLVGQRRPDDPRGSLVFRFVDAIAAKRPRAFVMENVPGLAASRVGGARLTEVLHDQFAHLGYEVLSVRLNAVDYLVPQRRERLFMIGGLGFLPEVPDAATFMRELLDRPPTPSDVSARAAIGDLGACAPRGGLARYSTVPPSPFAALMRSGSRETVTLHEQPRMSDRDRLFVAHIPPGGNYRDIPDAMATSRIMRFKETGGRTTTYGRLHPEMPAYTINTYFRRPNVGCHFHYSEPRLITAREAMRFQALPDRFHVEASRQDERNALIGNAVPSLLAEAVAVALARCMRSAEAVSGQAA